MGWTLERRGEGVKIVISPPSSDPSRCIDSMHGNRFYRYFMGFPLEDLRLLFTNASRMLLPIVLLIPLVLGGCATTQEPTQVKLDHANVLPLAIDPSFTFRKQTQFLNDPAFFPPSGAQLNEAIAFERKFYMWPATTALDKDQLKGNYLNFYWRNQGAPANVTVRLEYRQANLGNYVMAREKSYTNVQGSACTRFSIIGDDYLENGQITDWRCLLIVDGRIVGLTQSYLWK